MVENSTYQLSGYTYHTNENGQLDHVKASDLKIKPPNSRVKNINGYIEDMLDSDQKGHVIADLFGGHNDLGNIVAMDGELNQKTYKSMETLIAKSLINGAKASMEVYLLYPSGDTKRPSKIYVQTRIDSAGYVYHVPFEFDN